MEVEMSKPTINEEIRKLCGIGPRYNFTEAEAAKKPEDPAQVASKEYQASPKADKDGGRVDDGGGATTASAGGVKEHPGLNNKTSKAPAGSKEGGEVRDGGGMAKPAVGGAKEGPGQNDKTKEAPEAEKEGGRVDDGGDAKTPKAGGATPGDAKRKDDGLRAEHREARTTRMRELIALLDGE
jgi:hypothetical protein